jgi:hypothetical protein
MRAVAKPGTISRSFSRATKPSGNPSNVQTTGPQGTTGGKATPGRKPGATRGTMRVGQEKYLWGLVFAELVLTGALRKYFRSFHGG